MRKHTGEGLLHCPLCTKPTTNSYALKKHMETHQQPLMKVLSSIGIASMIEDFSETTLTALRNLAHLATKRSSEFASKQKMNKQENTRKDTNIQGSNMYKADLESSVVAQRESRTDHISKCMVKAENSEIDSRELKAQECNKNDNIQSPDTIKVDNHERHLLRDYSKGDDNSLEMNNSDELLPEKSIVFTEKMEERKTESKKSNFVVNDKEQLELTNNEGSTVAAQEQTFGSLILQGTPAVVLMQLVENIVESHFGSFHAEEVRPTLGDQLVEQCLEVMMHDDTSRSSDDGKSGDACAESSSVHDLSLNTDKQNISRAHNNSNNKEKIDAYMADTLLDSNTHMDDQFLSGESESDFYVYTDNTDFCDARSKNSVKKEKYDKYDRTTDNKEIGLFQREVLGDDSYVFST